jgi:transcriptional regulator with XRE-family HTH domain
MADLEFGPVVKALRLRAGLSQSGLAEAAGLDSRGTVSRLERIGTGVTPTLSTLQALAGPLGTDTWRMVRWAEKAQRAAEAGGVQSNEDAKESA